MDVGKKQSSPATQLANFLQAAGQFGSVNRALSLKYFCQPRRMPGPVILAGDPPSQSLVQVRAVCHRILLGASSAQTLLFERTGSARLALRQVAAPSLRFCCSAEHCAEDLARLTEAGIGRVQLHGGGFEIKASSI